MNKIRLVLICIPFFISALTFGQETDFEKLTVGFSCGMSGKTTPLVDKMADLVQEKKFSEISSYLNSKNSGELYLAIIILERLADKNLYTIDENEQKIISRIKSIAIQVVNCYGCFRETNSMIEMFEKENFIGEDAWLDKIIPSD